MGKRGPAPTPTAINRLRNFPGKRSARAEPKPSEPTDEALRPPEWLDEQARDEWKRLQPELTRLGLLTLLDLSHFAAYCQWYSRWRAHEADIAELRKKPLGEFVVTPNGHMQAHPLVSMSRHAAAMMLRFAAHFGLSPSDRVGMDVGEPSAPEGQMPPAGRNPPSEFERFIRQERRTPPKRRGSARSRKGAGQKAAVGPDVGS